MWVQQTWDGCGLFHLVGLPGVTSKGVGCIYTPEMGEGALIQTETMVKVSRTKPGVQMHAPPSFVLDHCKFNLLM